METKCDEATSLIVNKRLSLCAALRRQYQVHVYTRGANIVLLCCGLAFSTLFQLQSVIFLSPIFVNYKSLQPNELSYVILVFHMLYPLFGVIGETFTRHKVINAGLCLLIVGNISMILSQIVTYKTMDIVMFSIACICGSIGYGIILTNFYQFGLDQLLSKPSEKLQSYIYWCMGVIYLPSTAMHFFFALLVKLVHHNALHWCFISANIVLLLLTVLSWLISCCCKRHINIEPPPRVNPVKHIYKVMKYAWLHKYPVRRSAYTYTEMPSRLDLCKERYGGPFTTDEVEMVKSFWRILLLLISTFGVICYDTVIDLTTKYYHHDSTSYEDISTSFTKIVIIAFPLSIINGTISLCIVTMQLVHVPCFLRYFPRLLTRMGVGLFLALCTSCCLTLLSMWLDNGELFPYGLLAIPLILRGCSFFLSFLTGIEFIIAQSPLKMQGLLIGFWISAYNIFILLPLLISDANWYYYMAKTVLVFVSCLCFLVAARRYKYRERNEVTDVNERLIIVDYTARQLQA